MERMKIRLVSVAVCPEERVTVARVQAVSARKVGGRPVAIIGLEVRLRSPPASHPTSLVRGPETPPLTSST